MCCEKYTFKIFLHISFLETTVTADSVKNSKSFVMCLQLFQRIKEVFHKYLSYFPIPCSYDKPFEKKFFKCSQTLPQPDKIIVEQNFINRENVDQRTCNFLAERKRCDDIVQKSYQKITTLPCSF